MCLPLHPGSSLYTREVDRPLEDRALEERALEDLDLDLEGRALEDRAGGRDTRNMS